MRISALLRTATLALALTAVTGAMTVAFADDSSAPAAQQQASTNAPYDDDGFVVPANNVQP